MIKIYVFWIRSINYHLHKAKVRFISLKLPTLRMLYPSFIRHPSSVILHPASCILHPASCIFVIMILVCNSGYSQFSAGRDDTINPGVPVTLTATYGLIGNGITISDDDVDGPFPIGFSFSYFGNIYTEFYIGANGWISFSPNPNAAGTRQAFAVP